eukprot:jgi/Botrbrau1/22996/Bobra.0030s0060.1
MPNCDSRHLHVPPKAGAEAGPFRQQYLFNCGQTIPRTLRVSLHLFFKSGATKVPGFQLIPFPFAFLGLQLCAARKPG